MCAGVGGSDEIIHDQTVVLMLMLLIRGAVRRCFDRGCGGSNLAAEVCRAISDRLLLRFAYFYIFSLSFVHKSSGSLLRTSSFNALRLRDMV